MVRTCSVLAPSILSLRVSLVQGPLKRGETLDPGHTRTYQAGKVERSENTCGAVSWLAQQSVDEEEAESRYCASTQSGWRVTKASTQSGKKNWSSSVIQVCTSAMYM